MVKQRSTRGTGVLKVKAASADRKDEGTRPGEEVFTHSTSTA
jgi:hypothetical protein